MRGWEEMFRAYKWGSAYKNGTSGFVDWWWHRGRVRSRQVVPRLRNVGFRETVRYDVRNFAYLGCVAKRGQRGKKRAIGEFV